MLPKVVWQKFVGKMSTFVFSSVRFPQDVACLLLKLVDFFIELFKKYTELFETHRMYNHAAFYYLMHGYDDYLKLLVVTVFG